MIFFIEFHFFSSWLEITFLLRELFEVKPVAQLWTLYLHLIGHLENNGNDLKFGNHKLQNWRMRFFFLEMVLKILCVKGKLTWSEKKLLHNNNNKKRKKKLIFFLSVYRRHLNFKYLGCTVIKIITMN